MAIALILLVFNGMKNSIIKLEAPEKKQRNFHLKFKTNKSRR